MEAEELICSEEGDALLSEENGDVVESANTLKRELTFPRAFALTVSAISGTTIYITPSLIAKLAPNMFTAIIIWICAGGISLLAALCYCEAATVVQKTGSSFIFVRECYGEACGFIVTWINAVLLAPIALSVMFEIMGRYLSAPFFEDRDSYLFKLCSKTVSISILLVVSVVSCLGVKKITTITYIFNILQLLLFALCIGIGIHWAVVSTEPCNLSPNVMFDTSGWHDLSKVIPALSTGIFNALISFEGWYIIATYVEEIKNPGRNIPLLTLTTIPFLTFAYVAVNIVMLTVLSQKEMASSLELFTTFIAKGGNQKMSYIVSVFMLAGGIPGLLGSLYHLSRVILSSAREGQFPQIFAFIHQVHRTPVFATAYCSIVASIAILIADIPKRVILGNFAVWIEYAMGISTVLVFRWTLPDVKRTYRVWICTPIFMLLVCVGLLTSSLWRYTLEAGIVLVVIASGIPIYYVAVYKDWLSVLCPTEITSKICEALNMVKCEFDGDNTPE